MIEKTLLQETQLTVLGVGGLPDNLAVGIFRKPKDLSGNQETSNPANRRRRNQRTISETGVDIGDPLSMKRQLQLSFSSLDEFESTFQVRNKYYKEAKILQFRMKFKRFLKLCMILLKKGLMSLGRRGMPSATNLT